MFNFNQFNKILFGIIGAFAILASCNGEQRESADAQEMTLREKPNVVIIFADDLDGQR